MTIFTNFLFSDELCFHFAIVRSCLGLKVKMLKFEATSFVVYFLSHWKFCRKKNLFPPSILEQERRRTRIFFENGVAKPYSLLTIQRFRLPFSFSDVNRKKTVKIDGEDPGSPENPKMIKKFLYCTGITTIIFIIIYLQD